MTTEGNPMYVLPEKVGTAAKREGIGATIVPGEPAATNCPEIATTTYGEQIDRLDNRINVWSSEHGKRLDKIEDYLRARSLLWRKAGLVADTEFDRHRIGEIPFAPFYTPIDGASAPRDSIPDLAARLVKLEWRGDAFDAKLGSIGEMLDRAGGRLSELDTFARNQLPAVIGDRIDELVRRIHDITSRTDTAINNLDAHHGHIAGIDGRIAELTGSLARTNGRMTPIENHLAAIEKTLGELMERRAAAKSESVEQVSQYGEPARDGARKETVIEALRRVTSERDNARTDLAAVGSQIRAHEVELVLVRSQRDAREIERDDARSELAETKKQRQLLINGQEVLRRELDAALEHYQRTQDSLAKERDDYRHQLVAANTHCEGLKRELAEVKRKSSVICNQLQTVNELAHDNPRTWTTVDKSSP
jgi:chromosome segregation ATPase